MAEDLRATIRLFNYRCFGSESPGILEIRPGFTAFVGTNNSGKSTLLRAVRELRGVFAVLGDVATLAQMARGDPWSCSFVDVEDPNEIYNDRNTGPVVVEVEMPTSSSDELTGVRLVGNRQAQGWSSELYVGPRRVSPSPEDVRLHGLTFINEGGGRQAIAVGNASKLAQLLTSAVYIPAFRHAISGATGTTGGDLLLGADFLNTWAAWQTGAVKSQRQRVLKVVEDIRALFGYKQLSVQPAVGNATLQIFVDGKDYRLRELGAGLTQFLLVLGTVAIKNPGLILIDEPELNLHPTLQQEFLTAIGGYATYGVMFATHSLGLARSAASYLNAVQRRGGDSSVHAWETVPGAAELLGELNYSAYREAGHDRILCVEGLHDVRPVQQILRLLRAEYSTLVVQGGGDQLCSEAGVELICEMRRLSKHVFVLLDSERTEAGGAPKPSRQWFVEQISNHGVRGHLTERRALENYFPESAVQRAVGPQCEALKPYEAHNASRWKKRDNWRIAREIAPEELEDSDVVRFLREIVGGESLD